MSIILDALRRADADRGAPAGNAAALRVPGSRRRESGRWVWIAVALVLANLTVLMLWMSREEAPVTTGVETRDGAPAEQADATPPDPVARTEGSAPSGSTVSAPPPPITAAPTSTTTPSTILRGAPTATGNLPLLSELPPEILRDMPSFRLDVHVYADDPASRFVMLDLERLGEGDTSRAGLEVVEIQPDGVILRWRGRDFLSPR